MRFTVCSKQIVMLCPLGRRYIFNWYAVQLAGRAVEQREGTIAGACHHADIDGFEYGVEQLLLLLQVLQNCAPF